MKYNIKIKNDDIERIQQIALDNNYEIYLVGGFIRDLLLGVKKQNQDIDIIVAGDAIEFAGLCASEYNTKLSAVYKKFGTALLMSGNTKIEFASARKESYFPNSRKPIVRLSSITDDLSRRDFTINALAVRLKEKYELIDLFDGLKDLENKIIRTPLDSQKTFEDDPLRMLRAIRFAAILDFSIEKKTLDGIKRMNGRLAGSEIVSQERITNEFLLILTSKMPSSGLKLLLQTGILELIFPELAALSGVEQINEYHHKDVFNHTLEVVDNISSKSDDIWLKFAALLHDIGKPITKKFIDKTGWTFHGHEEIGARMVKNIFQRMRLSNNKLEYVQRLVRLHLRPIPLAEKTVTDSAIRRLIVDAGDDLEDLLALCRADVTSKNPEKIRTFLNNFDIVEKKIFEVKEKDKLRNFQSPVRGDEIMQICKLQPSREVGIIKKKIEEAILDGLIPNEYEAAKSYLFKIKDNILK